MKYLGKSYIYKGEKFKVVEEFADTIVLNNHRVLPIDIFQKRVKNGTYKEVSK